MSNAFATVVLQFMQQLVTIANNAGRALDEISQQDQQQAQQQPVQPQAQAQAMARRAAGRQQRNTDAPPPIPIPDQQGKSSIKQQRVPKMPLTTPAENLIINVLQLCSVEPAVIRALFRLGDDNRALNTQARTEFATVQAKKSVFFSSPHFGFLSGPRRRR